MCLSLWGKKNPKQTAFCWNERSHPVMASAFKWLAASRPCLDRIMIFKCRDLCARRWRVMQHWELVPEHDIKTSSQANACVLLAISALSNLFRREAVFIFFVFFRGEWADGWAGWGVEIQKQRTVSGFLRERTQTRTHEGEKKKQGLVGKDKA